MNGDGRRPPATDDTMEAELEPRDLWLERSQRLSETEGIKKLRGYVRVRDCGWCPASLASGLATLKNSWVALLCPAS